MANEQGQYDGGASGIPELIWEQSREQEESLFALAPGMTIQGPPGEVGRGPLAAGAKTRQELRKQFWGAAKNISSKGSRGSCRLGSGDPCAMRQEQIWGRVCRAGMSQLYTSPNPHPHPDSFLSFWMPQLYPHSAEGRHQLVTAPSPLLLPGWPDSRATPTPLSGKRRRCCLP